MAAFIPGFWGGKFKIKFYSQYFHLEQHQITTNICFSVLSIDNILKLRLFV